MKKYIVTDSATNTGIMGEFISYEEAQKEIINFENSDKLEGIYEEDFYQIIIK